MQFAFVTAHRVIAVAGLFLPLAAGAQQGTIAITGATVIDVTTGRLAANQTVLIAGNRIQSVGPATGVSIPPDARRVDGSGKFVIPGLWDMHVHATGYGVDRLFLPMLVANGITGVRDMFGRLAWYDSARALARRGEIESPRIIGSGHILDGSPAIWPGSIGVTSAEEARRTTDSLVDAGAAFIKVYSRLTKDEFLAVADESKKRGIPFAGHVPTLVLVREATDAGMKSIEHLQQLTTACSGQEDSLRAELVAAIASSKGWDSAGVVGRRQAPRIIGSFDRARCAELAGRLKRNGTWMVPTMTVLHSVSYLDDTTLARDARLKYIPKYFSATWNPANDFRFKVLTAEDWANRKRLFEEQREIVRILHKAGVQFLAGTDLSNPYVFPGYSLHDELANFVAEGFTPLEALQAATLSPARYFAATDSLGTVAPGKVADLVVLDANPLIDIRNVARIFAVVANGRLIDAGRRAELLAAGEKIAGGGKQ